MNDSSTMSFLTLLWTLICLILILFLAYFSVKLLAKKQRISGAGKLIKVLDQVSIGQDKVLVVVKVADKTMLIAMSSNTVTKVCELDNDYCEKFILQNPVMPFSEVLKSAFNKTKNDDKNNKGDGKV